MVYCKQRVVGIVYGALETVMEHDIDVEKFFLRHSNSGLLIISIMVYCWPESEERPVNSSMISKTRREMILTLIHTMLVSCKW